MTRFNKDHKIIQRMKDNEVRDLINEGEPDFAFLEYLFQYYDPETGEGIYFDLYKNNVTPEEIQQLGTGKDHDKIMPENKGNVSTPVPKDAINENPEKINRAIYSENSALGMTTLNMDAPDIKTVKDFIKSRCDSEELDWESFAEMENELLESFGNQVKQDHRKLFAALKKELKGTYENLKVPDISGPDLANFLELLNKADVNAELKKGEHETKKDYCQRIGKWLGFGDNVITKAYHNYGASDKQDRRKDIKAILECNTDKINKADRDKIYDLIEPTG